MERCTYISRFKLIEKNVNRNESFDGAPLIEAKYTCNRCDLPIEKSYAFGTGVCGYCYQGHNPIGINLDRVYGISVYIPDLPGNIRHKLSKEIVELKDLENLEKFKNVILYGLKNKDNLDKFDALVPPPRGESDKQNHMKKVCEEVSQEIDIPVRDVLSKKEDYKSQKDIDDPKERKENLEDNIKCESNIDADRAVIVDDVATTCATLAESAKALKQEQVSIVRGLVIARDAPLQGLKDANIIEEVDE